MEEVKKLKWITKALLCLVFKPIGLFREKNLLLLTAQQETGSRSKENDHERK